MAVRRGKQLLFGPAECSGGAFVEPDGLAKDRIVMVAANDRG